MATTPVTKASPVASKPAPPVAAKPAAKTDLDIHVDRPERAPAQKAAKAPNSLTTENAWTLFYNGHRVAKVGDPPDKWVSMGRLGDGTPVAQTAMTPELEQEIKEGEYYLAEGVVEKEEEPAPTAPPGVVDIPYASADATPPVVGTTCNCTMGNWTGTPSAYAYQWTRDGAYTPSATASTYVLVAADIGGKSIACVVTATNALGSTTAPPSNAIMT